MKKLGIIDYNAGNIKSVQNALENLKIPYFISADPKELKRAEKILFPGVGHAKTSMQELQQRGLDTFLKNTTQPVLGICVGMQLLFDWAEEGNVNCLEIIEGPVQKFSVEDVNIVPHMGWNEVSSTPLTDRSLSGVKGTSPLFKNIPQNTDFYFVHSYYCAPTRAENFLAVADYNGKVFCCAAQKNNFLGVQFHPEKSGVMGQRLLRNFWEM